MQFDQLLGIFQLGALVKIFFVVLGAFYLVLTGVIYRQVQLMNQILLTKMSSVLATVALLQVAAGGVLLLLALILA